MLAKASVNMLKGDSLSKVEEEIKKINKKEEKLKRLKKEEDNKFSCCFEGFLRYKYLFCWCVSSISNSNCNFNSFNGYYFNVMGK
jgi:hypothetical protein